MSNKPKDINSHLTEVINKILTKEIIPVKICKTKCAGYFSIEIETEAPKEYLTILYGNEMKRDKDFNHFDDKVFSTLRFNPNQVIPGVINIKNCS